MSELIAPELVEKALLFLAVAGPLVGAIIGALIGAHTKNAAPSIISGILIGATGSLVYGIWRVYGAITNMLGLDSLTNLGVQLLMFAVLGAVLGVAIFKISIVLRRSRAGG